MIDYFHLWRVFLSLRNTCVFLTAIFRVDSHVKSQTDLCRDLIEEERHRIRDGIVLNDQNESTPQTAKLETIHDEFYHCECWFHVLCFCNCFDLIEGMKWKILPDRVEISVNRQFDFVCNILEHYPCRYRDAGT